MQMKQMAIGTTVLLVMVAVASEADACSCMLAGPPCQNAFQADAVFAGTVQAISDAIDDDSPYRTLRVEFSVAAAFRGIEGSQVSVRTATNGAACGYAFKQGERYLVYAYRTDKGQLRASICSRTRPLDEAAEDLRFLQGLGAPTGGTRVYGAITHREQDLSGVASREYGPVRDVLVRVQGVAQAFEARTDAQGRYEVVGLPPGKYEVTAQPPPGFSARHRPQTVELRDARACHVADFSLRYDGRISGSVRSAAGPVEGAEVEVVEAARAGGTGYITTLRRQTDANGEFEFSDVPTGRYVVGVDLTRSPDATVVFPPTFHPGTTDITVATVVEINGAQRLRLEPMTLPPPRRAHELTGIVTFDDGRPVSGAFIWLVDGTAIGRYLGMRTKTDADGRFSFLVHEGLSYAAHASYGDPSEGKPFGARVGPFVVTSSPAPLTVVLLRSR